MDLTSIPPRITHQPRELRPGRRHVICVLMSLCLLSVVPAEEPRKDLHSLRKAAHEAASVRSLLKTSLSRARRVAWESNLRARDARQTSQTAKGELTKARKALAEKAANNPSKEALKAARRQVDLIQLAHERAVSRLAKAEEALKAAGREFDKHLAEHNKAVGEHTKHLRKAQRAARREGRFVSFAEDVAPILVGHCLACHSARIAKGRVDLENHRGILSSGKNGATVTPGDVDASLLFHAISDGSMPDGNPALTGGQIAIIRRWIEYGAELDAGIDPVESLWNIVPQPPQPKPPRIYRVPLSVTALAFSPDGKWLASSGYHEVLVWEVATGRLARRITNVGQRVFDIDFHPSGRSLIVAAGRPGHYGELKHFQVIDGKLIHHLMTSTKEVLSTRFNPSGDVIAAAVADSSIRMFESQRGQPLLKLLDHHKAVMSVAWSPDGKRLASASRDKNAKVFDARTGQQLATFNKSFESNFGGRLLGVAFTPDGKQVVSCGNDKTLRIWNSTDAKLVRTIKGFDGTVIRVVVGHDGRVYSCGGDHTVRIHSLDGRQVNKFDDHKDWIYSLAVDATNGRLATGSYDGEIRIRDIEAGSTVRAFIGSPGFHTRN